MKFGLFLMPEPFPWSNWTLSYDLKLEEIAYAERFGYDEVWVGEHHTGAYENIPAPDIFMSMVQNGYPPVYRHKSFEFGEARSAGGRIAQRVHIVDDNGEAWEAMYTLEQQPDGSLKITGCSLLKAGQAV